MGFVYPYSPPSFPYSLQLNNFPGIKHKLATYGHGQPLKIINKIHVRGKDSQTPTKHWMITFARMKVLITTYSNSFLITKGNTTHILS